MLGEEGWRDIGWGRALTYSILSSWAEGLTNKQGCQGRLKEVSSILHALHPSRVGGLQRQSQNEVFPSRVFLICFPRPILSSPPPNRDCTLSEHSGFVLLYSIIPFGGIHGFIAVQLTQAQFSKINLRSLGWANNTCLLPTEFKSKTSGKYPYEEQKGSWEGEDQIPNLSGPLATLPPPTTGTALGTQQ